MKLDTENEKVLTKNNFRRTKPFIGFVFLMPTYRDISPYENTFTVDVLVKKFYITIKIK